VKKAVIMGVGAEQGLGSQLAKRIASEGLHVFVASRTQSRLDALTVEIEQAGGKATAVCADATNEEQVIKLFEKQAAGLTWQSIILATIIQVKSSIWMQNISRRAGNHAALEVSFLAGRLSVTWSSSVEGLCYSLVQALHCEGGPILVPSIPQRQDCALLLRQWPRNMVQREFM